MLLNRLYYRVKPLLPMRFRLALRRLNARQKRRLFGNHWPINPALGIKPEGWPGWPGGKQFAFVLTHDVESQAGVDQCRRVAELEMKFGFRSSFNFIPEGPYSVPSTLRSWLTNNGFEVGIHDLRHDGKIYTSESAFRRDAEHINHYVAEWGAAGFRAGFMLHRLDWLHALNIEYDASTFDVDPFEPQPDAANTIFPFWVPAPDPDEDSIAALRRPSSSAELISDSRPLTSGSSTISDLRPSGASRPGYIELPYTLVQDFNLFVVLKEDGIGIWKTKFRWLAEKGGMVLLDTHPDYMSLNGARPRKHEYPVARYADFLLHVQREYAGAYWHGLPRELARFCREFRPRHTRPPRSVCMLSYSFYESDNRVRRYAETLVRRGDRVKVFCLASAPDSPQQETMEGVEIVRLQTRRKNERSQGDYFLRLTRFWLKALWAVRARNLAAGCDLVHVHNIPDFLVFAAILPKLRGASILLDLHDLVPELYQEKFVNSRNALTVKLLQHVECWSCGFSDHVIVANHLWKEKVGGRSAPLHKLTALVNNVDLNLFRRLPRTRNDGRFVLLYPGTLNHHQGLDVALEAMAILRSELPEAELRIYGAGPAKQSLRDQAARLGLGDRVFFGVDVPITRIPELMAQADLGVVPKRAEGFGNEAYSTKIMEFMSQGLPVVASRTKIDSLYFDENTICFCESGNAVDLAEKVLRIARDHEYRETLVRNGLAYAEQNSWASVKHIYLNVVDRLTLTGITVR